ncbi:MAG: PorP/SprF family type IX secretion system membrane protein [Bacteroidota bacterium]
MSASKGDMMQFYRSLLLFWLILCGMQSFTYGQDPTYSQFFANYLHLNPAMTGLEGGTTLHTQYRDQWARIAGRDAKFITRAATLSIDMPCWNSAIGLFAQSNTEGEGFLQWNQAGFAYAFRPRHQKVGSTGYKMEWSLGFSFSYNWFSIRWDQLRFSDQFDPITGFTGNPSAFQPANRDVPTTSFFDLNVGGHMLFQSKNKDQTRIGFALNHLSNPDYSLINNDAFLPIRATIHASHIGNVSSQLQVIPLGKIDWQTFPFVSRDSLRSPGVPFWGTGVPLVSLTAGTLLSYGRQARLWGGGMIQGSLGDLDGVNGTKLQSIYSLIAVTGYRYPVGENGWINVGLSHDFNIRGMSDGLGTTEVFIRFNFGNGIGGFREKCTNCKPQKKWLSDSPL